MKQTPTSIRNKEGPVKISTKRPWNRINTPIYSISSTDGNGNANMHIIIYVTAISMQPKLFVCGVYLGTKTFDNITQYPHFVLQLLAEHRYPLVNLLGRQTGHAIDKIERLRKRNELIEWKGLLVLKNCLAAMEMQVLNSMEAGDHIILLCDVLAYKNINAGSALTLDTLRKHKLTRI